MTTFFRAVVMLGVLVGLPAAWIHYGPLPPAAQRVVDGLLADAKKAVDWDHIDWSKWSLGKLTASRNASTKMQTAQRVAKTSPPLFTPASLAAAPRSAPPTARQRQTPQPTEPARSLSDELEPLLVRLRACTPQEYELVRWGSDRQLFRFSCEMSLGDGDDLTQQFEAVGDTPAAAVGQVVAEVETWQAERRSLGGAGRFASN